MFGQPVSQTSIDAQGQPIRYWGCRAIDDRGRLDIVHDRVTYNGPDSDKELPQDEWLNLSFVCWLNTEALPELRQRSASLPRNQVVVIKRVAHNNKELNREEERFCLVARREGGYIYVGAWEYHTCGCKYDLTERPDGEWSATFDPNIGNRVRITMNNFGTGTVVSYFCEHGYRGVRVKLDQQPEWHKKQGQPPYALVFGAEIAEINEAA